MSHSGTVESFANLAARLGKDDELRQEHAVVEGVQRKLRVSPSSLATASAAWEDPYLRLSFTHTEANNSIVDRLSREASKSHAEN